MPQARSWVRGEIFIGTARFEKCAFWCTARWTRIFEQKGMKGVCHIRLRVKLRRDRRGAEMQRFFCDRINRMGQDEEKIGDGDVLSIDYPP